MKSKLQPGSILISNPFANLTNIFQRTVILILKNQSEGSAGLILNKETDLKVNEALSNEKFPKIDSSLFFGGPSDTDIIHFLGTHPISDSNDIKGIHWGGDLQELMEKIRQGIITKNEIKFYAGSTLWYDGLLEEEIDRGYWEVHNIKLDILFKRYSKYNEEKSVLEDWNTAWTYLTGSKYGEYNFPVEPSLN